MTQRISAKRLRVLFTLFERLHRREWVRLASGIAGSLCFIAILGILSRTEIHIQESVGRQITLNYAQLALGVILLMYLYFDWKLALGFTLVLYGFYRLAAEVPPEFYLWILGVGVAALILDISFLEKRKIKLFNLGWAAGIISLVGPLWLYARTLGYDKREH